VVAAHQHVSGRGHDEPVGGGITREREGLPLLAEEPAAVREHEVARILHGLVLSLRDPAAAVAGNDQVMDAAVDQTPVAIVRQEVAVGVTSGTRDYAAALVSVNQIAAGF